MMGLLVFKEQLKTFYGEYSFVIDPIGRSILALAVFLLLNGSLGFMEILKNPVVIGVACLLSAFLPLGFLTWVAAAFLLLHLYSLSLELAVVAGILVLTVAILYCGFQPGNTILMVVGPLLFFLKVPYLLPLLVGLSCGLSALVPMCFGVFIYYLAIYARQNAGVLAAAGTIDITQKYMRILNSLFANKMMLLMVAAFAAAAAAVFLIRNLPVDHAWTIAIVVGTAVELAAIFVGQSTMDVSLSIGPLAMGTLLSVVLAFIFQFFVFAVDYSRTEFLQFQDDEYYYYVKAVPKIAVTAPDVKVQRINKRKEL